MNRYTEKQNLLVELIQTENLLRLSEGHRLMSIGLKRKVQVIKEKLESLSEDIIDAKLAMLFSGNAVSGSMGIKSTFLSKILKPIQEMVKFQTAEIKLKKFGKVKGADDSDLYLTALPTGSFGIELSQLNTSNLFSEQEVNDAINQVADIIKKTTESDDKFAEVADSIPSKTLNSLKLLLKEVSDEKSFIKLQTSSFIFEIDKDQVKLGYERIVSAEETEELLRIDGVLKGLLLESNKFEFLTENDGKISGKISDEISEEDKTEFGRDYLNKHCSIDLRKITIKIAGSKPSVSYTLMNLQQD